MVIYVSVRTFLTGKIQFFFLKKSLLIFHHHHQQKQHRSTCATGAIEPSWSLHLSYIHISYFFFLIEFILSILQSVITFSVFQHCGFLIPYQHSGTDDVARPRSSDQTRRFSSCLIWWFARGNSTWSDPLL